MLVVLFIICRQLRSTSSSMPTILKGGHWKQTPLIPFLYEFIIEGENIPIFKFSESEIMLILKGYFIKCMDFRPLSITDCKKDFEIRTCHMTSWVVWLSG